MASTHDGGNGSRPRLATLPSDVSSGSRPPPTKSSKAESVSDTSSKGKEKIKYQAKGKDTKAPRGRGGGVPIKKTVAPSPGPPVFRSESSAGSYALPPDQKTWLNFKVWTDGREEMRPYTGFSYDEDMQHGSVLIYFKEEVDEDHPIPSIRADLDVLQNSGSTWLSNALLYSLIDDNDVDDWALSENASSPSQPFSPNFPQPAQRRMLGPTSPGGRSPPPFDIDQSHASIDSRATSRAYHPSEASHGRQPNSPPPFQQGFQRNPTHEIWFTAPDNVKTPQAQRLHHVAIRNFLAMLHGKPIVGSDVFDMLSTLQPQIHVMYDLDTDTRSGMTARERSVQMIVEYLGRYGIDDLRNNIRRALGLLAWAEQDSVKWRQGYLESFVHLAGVMTQEIEDHPDFKRLSVVTRRNLGLAAKTLQLRVMEAEEKLSTFDFGDLWEDMLKTANTPVYQSYQSFRQFLIGHFTRIYGNWPPTSDKTWLNRKVVNAMQEDFGSLYDYFVDREVIWNPREERASRKWEMAHRKNDSFRADLPELGMTDMLVTYDAKNGYAHIPHPYPLLPREVPKTNKDKEKKSFFSSLKKDKPKDATKDAKAQLQLSIIFSDATNIEKLDVNFNGSTLIDKFEQFELTTDLKHMSPREARLGRWVLLYGILQVLSTLSVDVQGLRHTDGVRSFLNTDLKRMPEWVSNGQIEHLEARQQRSWCWQRAWDPMPAQSAPVELEATSTNANERTNHHDHQEARRAEISAHNFPSPPPQHALPPPPPTAVSHNLDGATLMQNDIRRLGEKINNLSLSHNAGVHFRQEFERRRENEKVIQDEFHDRKPRLQGETFGPRAARDQVNNNNHITNINRNDTYSPPRLDSLAVPPLPNSHANTRPRSRDRDRDRDRDRPHPSQRSTSRLDATFLLTDSDYSTPSHHTNDFIDRQQASLLPPPLSLHANSRSHTASLTTDIGHYPFGAGENEGEGDGEMQWPVPPGYSESNRDRRMDGDGGMGTWREGRESTVLGDGYRVMNFEDEEYGGRDGGRGAGAGANAGVRRDARRVRERGTWDT
ncbi:uncharacterized protein J4E88_002504 [Alternaria novae-zelandiae]|uniref:uncharacterized protein n=1 Tax=Alternaria novae-zelandiae TaxID=430562 RepID=UPI0020C59422|nr:uncharacterized protein J4E88_002504 [Alternaria novae-zelandiae]KAI4691027.1 hypothetical protein J4E88_002504 [Alternaria novae-zelandiae]